MYHISDLRKFIKCEKKYYYELDITSEFKPYLRTDEHFIDLIKEYFEIKDYYEGIPNENKERFFKEKDNYEWFVKARFENGSLRTNIPLIHRINDKYDIYFIYYGTDLNRIDHFSSRINFELLEELGLEINEIYYIYLNKDYIYHEELKVKELLLVDNKIKNKRIIEILKERYVNYQSIISKMEDVEKGNLPDINIKRCNEKISCPYFEKCQLNGEKVTDDSILHLVSSKYKYQMFFEGLKSLKDVDLKRLEGNRVQYSQIQASKNEGVFVDKIALKHWLIKIEYPICFIDFEWDKYLVPPYEGMRPLDPLCFEYALYILEEEGAELKHYTYVGTKDCRKEFLESLLKHIPNKGSIVAYNAYGAEKLRIKELGELYREYENDCLKIIKRLIDIQEPFTEGLIYDLRMAGNFSLKKLLSVVSNLSYESLDIGNGMDAVYSWRDIDKGTIEDEDEVYENLKQYCSLDAYGLYLVYLWLARMTE